MKKRSLKSRRITLCALLLAAVFGCAALAICSRKDVRNPVTVTGDPVSVRQLGNHPANNRQYRASVWLGVSDGKLFFYPHCGYASDRTSYDGFLCVFENGGASKLRDLEAGKNSVIIQGFQAPFLYYWDNSVSLGKESDYLYCYDLQSGEDRQLYAGNAMLMHNTYFSGEGLAYVPLWAENGKTPQFVCVKDGALSAVAPLTEGYDLNGKTYFTVAEYSDTTERILFRDENGTVNELSLGYARHRSVIPCENGLLIHNEGGSNILYWIDEAGEVRELFSVECLASISAVTVRGTDVYLSFKRYKEYGEIGMRRFENDALEGTYKISLTDFSAQKSSGSIYDGLYNFDDACLFACDENCGIYQLDLDGNVTRTLFSRRS